MTPAAFQAETNVSRETMARLDAYLALLRRWQPRINLVGTATLADAWRRHVLDSVQLLPFVPAGAPCVDLGSGAGFPGLALAICGVADMHLIESDTRKCAFLREAARITGTTCTVLNCRIEQAPADLAGSAGMVTARALAPLARLLAWTQPLLRPGGRALFLKGRRWREELTEARQDWHMKVDTHPSRSDPDGVILAIGDLRPVAPA